MLPVRNLSYTLKTNGKQSVSVTGWSVGVGSLLMSVTASLETNCNYNVWSMYTASWDHLTNILWFTLLPINWLHYIISYTHHFLCNCRVLGSRSSFIIKYSSPIVWTRGHANYFLPSFLSSWCMEFLRLISIRVPLVSFLFLKSLFPLPTHILTTNVMSVLLN